MKGVLAYVALGANLGDRLATLREAVRRIDATHGLSVLRASRVYETAPWGPPQPDYLNAVIEVDACKAPFAHLAALHAIEAALGRVRVPGERFGPRTLDLDLLWQGGLALHGSRGLALPHPRLHERAFVLTPLADLAPALVIRGKPVAEWLAALPPGDRAGVRALAGTGAWARR
jgi:2-amino-4-hydroxy-6-hydroxymethyldihydropteridine diphosphokinase